MDPIIEDPKGIENIIIESFLNLNRGSGSRPLPGVLEHRVLSKDLKIDLEEVFEEEKIKEAVFSLTKEKAPEPDGISMAFYHESWKIIKPDLMKLMKEFHRNGVVNSKTNATLPCLIPKKKESVKVSDFRPISLTTSLYKNIVETLYLRLGRVMGRLVFI